jgi:hypothetical protein
MAWRCTDELDASPVHLEPPLSTEGTAKQILQHAAQLIEPMIRVTVEQRFQVAPRQRAPMLFHRRKPKGNVAGVTVLLELHDRICIAEAEGCPLDFPRVGGFWLDFTRWRGAGCGFEALESFSDLAPHLVKRPV